MIISFDINEIDTFPDNVKDFLKDYINQKISNFDENHVEFVPNNNLNDGFTEFAPSFTRHPGRKLVTSKNLDWYELIGLKIEEFDLQDDFKMTIDGDNTVENVFRFDEGKLKQDEVLYKPVIKNDPRTWSVGIIFSCLFGFGGKYPGMLPAKNTKELADNLFMIGLGSDEPINSKVIGPLLKSITTSLRIYVETFKSNNYEEYLNWFSFIKNSNEFYFAGETREKCYIAAGKIAETYFKISREKFDKL